VRLFRSRRSRRILSVVIFVALWAAIAELNIRVQFINPLLLPTPWELVIAAWDLRQFTWLDLSTSLTRSLAGFAIAATLGSLAGLVVGYIKLAEDMFETLIELFRPIPALAFLPVFIMWFGIGEVSKVLLIAYACFFPVFLNTQQGVRYVDPVLVRAAHSLGANRLQIFTNVIVRGALPEILTGLRAAIALSLIVLTAAELVAADAGMGYRIQESRLQFRVDRMLYGAAMLGLVGYTLNLIMRAIEAYLLRWKSRVEQSKA
jgi:ABC-type nitrate/sulfonate/bicarbonate transport system permease component